MAASFLFLSLVAGFGVWSLPLKSPAFLTPVAPKVSPQQPHRVTPDEAFSKLEHRVNPVFPPEAIPFEGEVVLEVSISDKGEVSNIRVVSGPPGMIMPIVEAVRQWRYSKAMPLPAITEVRFNLKLVRSDEGDSPLPPQKRPYLVGPDEASPYLEHQVHPTHLPEAKQLGFEGEVILEVTINEKGEVSNIRVISGNPLLINSALDAVRQWRYSTAMPLPAVTRVAVNFRVDGSGESQSSSELADQEKDFLTIESSNQFLRNWLEQDVLYLASDEERAAYEKLTSDEEREFFIEQFWLKRDNHPNTPENEFRDEYFRRIAYANERFAPVVSMPASDQRKHQRPYPGWKTDRGRIYITWGPPDEIESHPIGGQYQRPPQEGGGVVNTPPFEIWRYRLSAKEPGGDEVLLKFEGLEYRLVSKEGSFR